MNTPPLTPSPHDTQGHPTPRLFSTLDHLVVMSRTLDEGVRWVEALLGLTPGPGGAHPLMGTHNRLINISGFNFPDCYLEIIALDPAAPTQLAPGLKRWFDMDDEHLRAQVARYGPQLIAYVVRSPDIEVSAQALAARDIACGRLVPASRQTDKTLLRWRISLRDDGQRLMDGALPNLIQWGLSGEKDAAHPTDELPGTGVQLQELQLIHPDTEALEETCQAIGLRCVQVKSGPPGICAVLQTPRGLIRLNSPRRPEPSAEPAA